MEQYNLGTLRQRVAVDKLDDEEFDPGIIDRFINDTQRQIFNSFELPFQEKIFQGTIPAGYTIFQMPNDLAQIQAQTVVGVPGFTNKFVQDWRAFFQRYTDPDNAPASAPFAWTLYGGNILLSAPTDQDYTLKTFYIKKPKLLVNNVDVPDVPEEFSELLILGAVMRIQRRNEDYELARETELEYERMKTDLVNRYGARQASGPIIMKNRQV